MARPIALLPRDWVAAPSARSSAWIEVASADPQARQLRHSCRVIRGEEEPRITGADATRTLAATLAVQRAAESGRPVTLG